MGSKNILATLSEALKSYLNGNSREPFFFDAGNEIIEQGLYLTKEFKTISCICRHKDSGIICNEIHVAYDKIIYTADSINFTLLKATLKLVIDDDICKFFLVKC